MLPTFILEIYNNTFFNEQETYYSLALTKSRWWELYEVEGLDPSFSSLEMSKTSDKTGALNSNTTYDNRSISFSLKLDPLNIDNALKLFSRYLINGTYCVIRIKENTKLFMPCYVSNYTFNRWQNNVTVEINLEAIDRFWHFEERITPYNQSEIFNIVSDVPTRPDILLIDVDLTAYADYFINKVYMTIDSVSLQPHLYQKGVEKIEDYEILEIDTYSNKINTADKFTFHVDCQQQQIYIKSENVTQQIETDISKIWDFQLKSGQHKITVTFDLVKDGQTVHQSVTPSQRLIISTNPLFITYPNSLTDEVDGLVLSENLKPENIKIGTNILGIEGNYGGGGFELYKGITEITPTLTEQSLQTKDTIVRKNITVKAIEPLYEDGVNVVDAVTDEATTATITNSKTITNKSSKVYVRPTIKSEGWYKAQDGDTQTEIQIDEAEQAKIVAENIKKGVSILGVVGTLESGGSSTSNLELINKAPTAGDIRQYLKKLDLSNIDTSNLKYCLSLFESCTNLESIIFPISFDTQNVVSFENMFSGCISLVSLDLSNFDTSNVTIMKKMFFSCSKLENIIVTSFNTNKVTDFSDMFSNCSSLVSLDLSNFDTTNLENATSMFANCTSLTSLDLSSFKTSKLTSIQTMFSNCSSLTTLNLSNFDTTNIVDMAGAFNCESLVNFMPPAVFAQNEAIATLDFVACPLSHSSAVALINSLATRTNEPILTLSLDTSETLTDEEKAIATAKGWTIL